MLKAANIIPIFGVILGNIPRTGSINPELPATPVFKAQHAFGIGRVSNPIFFVPTFSVC